MFAYLFTWHALYVLRGEHQVFAEMREDYLTKGDPDFATQTRYTSKVCPLLRGAFFFVLAWCDGWGLDGGGGVGWSARLGERCVSCWYASACAVTLRLSTSPSTSACCVAPRCSTLSCVELRSAALCCVLYRG